MNSRSTTLLAMNARAALHRLRHDLAKEIVVAICGAAVLALFLYIFNDFLNVQVKDISPRMRESFAYASALALLAVTTFCLIRALPDSSNIPEFAERIGEDPNSILGFRWARRIILTLFLFGTYWYLSNEFMLAWSWQRFGLWQGSALAIVVVNAMRKRSANPVEESEPRPLTLSQSSSRVAAMSRWRLQQILRRNFAAQLSLTFGTVVVSICLAFLVTSLPIFIPAFFAFLAGLFVAAAIIFQLQSDVKSLWTEQNIGISHQQFVSCYERLSWGLCLPGAALLFAACIATKGLSPSAFAAGLSVAGAYICGPVTTPWLMFQIDPTKAGVQIMTILIISLFLATALLAHPLSFLIFPLLRYYANQNQEGRFYRI